MLGFPGVGLHGWVGYLSSWYIDGSGNGPKKTGGNISHFYFSTLNTHVIPFSCFPTPLEFEAS